MDRAENIRRLKEQAKEPKAKKYYQIPKVSEKRKKQILADKDLLAADKEFYNEIWLASSHECQCGCKAKLGKEPLLTFFHHLLFKSKYPHLRHVPENIMLLHPDCHNSYHTNPDTRPEVKHRQSEASRLLL